MKTFQCFFRKSVFYVAFLSNNDYLCGENRKKTNLSMNHSFLFSALLALSTSAHAARPDSVNVFLYQHGDLKEGLKIAYSADNQTWTKLCDDYSYVKSDYGSWGSDKSMRSVPATAFYKDRWYAVWQVDKEQNQFAATYSKDLWLWKPQDYPYAKGASSVYNPTLTVEGGIFKVRFTTKEGKYYLMTSADFKKWNDPVSISRNEYNESLRVQTLTIGGKQISGVKHRMAMDDMLTLRAKTNEAILRNNACNERAAQDGERFKGMSALKATVTVKPEQTKAISDKLMGIFFEDINYGADGGLYAEMIQNRDFEYSKEDNGKWNAMTAWKTEGGLTATISAENPIHKNNSHFVVLNADGNGGALINEGWDGIAVKKGEKYDFSLFSKMVSGKNTVKVKLTADGKTIAEATMAVGTKEWKQQKAVLTAKETAANCVLTIEPQKAGLLAIDFVSLFPQKTFNNRKNGLRADLAQTLADLKPRFVRFPGGCLSHGNGIGNMYHWNETIGELWERKPQFNIWNYHQTKGLGFFEYFQFCEDIGAEPLPVLPAGVPCQNSSRGGKKGQQGGIPMEEMEAYTQELLNLIEWANGDAKTSPWAAKRAKAGHPKPFNLKMIGVGNEDIIGDVFEERFNYINRRIKAAYPEIEVVGTVGPFNEGSDYEFGWELAKRENVDIVDEHYYVQPGWFLHNRDFYDKYDRNGTKVYLGEWASWGRTLENALGEALHLTSVERNADVVVMASYAPMFGRNGHTQWNPDMIYFDNTSVEPTVNYYVQQLYGQNSGDTYIYSDLELTATPENGAKAPTAAQMAAAEKRVAHSVVKDSKTGDMIVKLVNCTNLPVDVNVDMKGDGAKHKAEITLLKGNKPGDINKNGSLKPEVQTTEIGDVFTQNLPPYSFAVVRVRR